MIKRLLWLICLGSLAYATTPTISNIQLNDKPYIEGDISTISPKISSTVLDTDHGVATWNIKIYRADTDSLKGTGTGNGGNTTSELAISFERSLENRAYYAIIDVTDAAGNTATTRIPTFNIVSTFQLNNVLSAPNPFNPHQTKAQIEYKLTKDASVNLFIYSISGEQIWTHQIAAGATGGTAGYNTVLWNGQNAYGETVANGPYILYLIAKFEGQTQKGKTKLLVLK